MSDILINENIFVTNVEEIIYNLNRYLKSDNSVDSLIEYIDTHKNLIFYIDDKLNSSICEQPESRYVWIDTGMKNGNKPIFISLLRKQNLFEGCYTGDADRLAESMSMYSPICRKAIYTNLPKFKEKYNKKQSEEYDNTKSGMSIEKISKNNSFGEMDLLFGDENSELEIRKNTTTSHTEDVLYDEIYNSLLINNWHNKNGLRRFIKIIGCRVEQLIDAKEEEYYILNNIKSAVVKTGLLDKYAADILVLYKWNVKQNCYVAEKVIHSKKELIEEGFKKEQIQKNIKTITFFDNNELLKGITIEDFDLNSECLKHILRDRRERFPVEVANCTVDFLAGKLRESLNMGLKILEHDIHYAKPSYSAKTKSITWFMPFYVHRSLSEKPELVFAIRMDSERLYYEVKTVLPYNDEIQDRITALSLYGESWS